MTGTSILSGLRVLVTRPQDQAATLAAAIGEAGGVAVLAPLMRIEPLADPSSQQHIRQRIQQLDHYDLVIFISTNAARLGAGWIDRYWPQLPQGLTLVAIGPATARELQALDGAITVAPGGMRSEDLLSLPVLTAVQGKRILVMRGRGGREVLADTLRLRGARVDYVELYERHPVNYPLGSLPALLRDRQVNVLTVTSSEILSALVTALVTPQGNPPDSNVGPWGLLPLLVPSERVQAAAHEAGFTTVINVHGADEEAMLQGLRSLVDGHR
ncbi:MAG: hypothetical protein RLZZ385_2599 [Pseudomonadota bacterium]